MPHDPELVAETRGWFQRAATDLAAGLFDLTAEPPLTADAVFHAQQAAEKYLKGFLVARGIDPPKIHDLRALLLLCRDHDTTLASLDNDCHALSQLGWMSRYPDSPAEPTEAEARRALDIAVRVREEVRRREASAPQ